MGNSVSLLRRWIVRRRARAPSNPFFVEFGSPDPAALDLDWNVPDPADCAYRTGHRLLARGFYEEALELFERATRYDRAHYDAYVAQSETLVLLGRAEDAARVSEDAMNRYGRNCALGAARGHVFLHQDDADSALECAEIATQNDPGSAYAWLVAGEARLAIGLAPAQALTLFARSRAADERWPHLNLRIALAYLEWGCARPAAGLLESVVRAEPDLPLAWMLLGDSYRAQGVETRALAAYRRAAALAPQLASARRALAWRARAAAAWNRAIRRVSGGG